MPGLEFSQLPTEAQWEYACRAGTTWATWAGDLEYEKELNVLNDIAWYGPNSDSQTHPVAQKKANPWGLYDMLGNVDEWCADWWAQDLGDNMVVDPTGPEEGTNRVGRGGSWINGARFVRAAYRSHFNTPGYRSSLLGFRCARVQESMSYRKPAGGDGGADAEPIEAPAAGEPARFEITRHQIHDPTRTAYFACRAAGPAHPIAI